MSKGFRLNTSGVRQLLNSPEVQKELRRRAEKVAAQANANAPLGETRGLSQSHEVEIDTSPGSKGSIQRARAKVYTNKKYALKVEAETGYLSSALDAAAD